MSTPHLPRPLAGQRNCRGFTLTEVMMATAVGSFMLVGIATTYIMTVREFAAIANYWEIHIDGRSSIDRFAADMRQVSAITSFATNGPLVVTIPTGFSSSGVVTSSVTVTYTYLNSTLKRTSTGTGLTSVLATNIYSLTFRLYDPLGSNTTILSNAKGVQMELFLRKMIVGRAQTEDYLSARLNMRNTPN